MQSPRHTSHKRLADNKRTVIVWLKRHCAVPDMKSSASFVARRLRRHDGRCANNDAEVTDALMPFVRESAGVMGRTVT